MNNLRYVGIMASMRDTGPGALAELPSTAYIIHDHSTKWIIIYSLTGGSIISLQ